VKHSFARVDLRDYSMTSFEGVPFSTCARREEKSSGLKSSIDKMKIILVTKTFIIRGRAD